LSRLAGAFVDLPGPTLIVGTDTLQAAIVRHSCATVDPDQGRL
jgi:hypothetical protein